jgi:CheY-like chemotaxis protein
VALSWSAEPGLWPVKADAAQLKQLLTALCENAKEAMQGRGTLALAAVNAGLDAGRCAGHPGAVPGDHVVISVADNGPGIAPEHLPKLFDPFFTTKDRASNGGLGLAIAYGIAEQAGGFVGVDSEPGRGATFTLCLPRYSGPDLLLRAKPAPSFAARGHERILLVEDEPALLKLAKAVLEGQGYQVLAASGPAEALALAADQKGKIDLLLTDVVMPEMNGWELYRAIARLDPAVKCAFMSGYMADVLSAQGAAAADVHFIKKPFTIKALAAAVRQALDRPD